MNEHTSPKPLLETAWRRYAALDENAKIVQTQFLRMRWVMAVLGVLAVLFAILVDNYFSDTTKIVGIVFRGLLILSPIVVSVIAAFSNRFQQGQKYISYRAAAEAILKEIYLYRTVNKHSAARDRKLSDRLAAIQRDLFRGAGGELVLTEFRGDVPPYYYSDDPNSDSGFADLTGEQYLKFRLEDQLNWHKKKNLELQRTRKIIQWAILAFGGIGAFLAAWPSGSFAAWVALTSAIATALVGWEELRGLDMRVGNYSQVILELDIIRDWWLALDQGMRTEKENAELAKQTEKILFDKNLEWASAMRKALAEADDGEAELVEDFIEEGRAATARIKETLYTEVDELAEEGLEEAVERVETVIEDSAAALESMFAGLTAIDEEAVELDLPPEVIEDEFAIEAPPEAFEDEFELDPPPESIDDAVDAALGESAVITDAFAAPPSEEAYPPSPEPVSVESAVDAAIAESSLFASTSEEILDDVDEFDEDFGAVDDEAIVADEHEDFSDAELAPEASTEVDDDDEDFTDTDDIADTGDFLDEDFGEDIDDELDYEGDMHESWDI